MKIDIEQNSAYEETAVTIRCAGLSREVMELLALLRVYDAKLTGRQGGETHILNAADGCAVCRHGGQAYLFLHG